MTPLPPPGPHGGDAVAVAAALGRRPRRHARPVAVAQPGGARSRAGRCAVTSARCAATPIRHGRPPSWPRPWASTRTPASHQRGGRGDRAWWARRSAGGCSSPSSRCIPEERGPLWRSNPHNPGGLLAGDDEHAEVWDEAFYRPGHGRWTRGDAGAVVVGSLTKLLACPGLRIGYVLVPEGGARPRRPLSAPPAHVGGQRVGGVGPARPPGVGSISRRGRRGIRALRHRLVRGLARPRARAPTLRRQLGAGRGARVAGPSGAARDRGARLHELRDARDGAHRRSCPGLERLGALPRSQDRGTGTSWTSDGRPGDRPAERKAHHDRSAVSRSLLARCGPSTAARLPPRRRVPRPPDQAPGVARSARGDRHPPVRHRRVPVRPRSPSRSPWRCSPGTTAWWPKG